MQGERRREENKEKSDRLKNLNLVSHILREVPLPGELKPAVVVGSPELGSATWCSMLVTCSKQQKASRQVTKGAQGHHGSFQSVVSPGGILMFHGVSQLQVENVWGKFFRNL